MVQAPDILLPPVILSEYFPIMQQSTKEVGEKWAVAQSG